MLSWHGDKQNRTARNITLRLHRQETDPVEALGSQRVKGLLMACACCRVLLRPPPNPLRSPPPKISMEELLQRDEAQGFACCAVLVVSL